MTTVHAVNEVYYNPRSNENDAVADKKERPAAAPVIFGGFDAVKEIAQKLIPKYHDHLATAHILYVSRSQASKSGGKEVPGKAYKVPPVYRYLTMSALAAQEQNGSVVRDDMPQADFIIEIALDVWNPMSPQRRTALVDHLLSRCVGVEDEKTGAWKWSIRPPQVQEFPEVAERNGAWNEDLSEMRDCLEGK